MSEERKFKNIAEYLKEVSKIKEGWSTPVLAFRGQENAEWPLASSAERRLQASSADQDRATKGLFIEYHQNLLTRCKLKNYHQREGKPLDELELLADLQHHGAATCLLDFTRNALVALWFACEKSNADGKVFVVNTADETAFLEITPVDIENRSIRDILEFKTRETGKDQADDSLARETSIPFQNKPNLWYWTPAHLNERIPAQHSLFLFGPPSSMGRQLKPEEIVIESASKEQIRRELEELHDIHEESLFPDFVGFAYTQRHNAPYDTPGAMEYLHRGTEAKQRGQYSEAIEIYNTAIKQRPNDDRAYCNRASLYLRLGERDLAFQDLTKAIECYDRRIQLDPNAREPYVLRGNAKAAKQDYSGAKQDYDAALACSDHPYRNRETYAIMVEGNHPSRILFNRANVKAELHDYEGVLEDYDAAIQNSPHEAGHETARLYFNRANVKSLLLRFEAAIEDYDESIRLGGLVVSGAYFNKGNALVKLGRFVEARQCYDEWSQAREQRPNSVGNMEVVKEILGRIDGREFKTTINKSGGLVHVLIVGRPQETGIFPFQGNMGNAGNFGGNGTLGGEGFHGQDGFVVQFVERNG